jgi:hypothetical protein
MFDLESDDIQEIEVYAQTAWGVKKYNFPVSYRLILQQDSSNFFTVVGNEGDVVPYTRNYLSFLVRSENLISPADIKIRLFGIEHPLTNLSFYMVSASVSGGFYLTYLEVYDLPTAEMSSTIIFDDSIVITEIEGFWKFDLENIDFSIYVESLPGDLRSLFC